MRLFTGPGLQPVIPDGPENLQFPGDQGTVCCSVFGDPNIRMFDGGFYSYQGGCKYNMATPKNGSYQVCQFILCTYINVVSIFKN